MHTTLLFSAGKYTRYVFIYESTLVRLTDGKIHFVVLFRIDIRSRI